MADTIKSTESFPTLRETPEEIAYELRAHEGALWTGSRMAIGIWAFAFAALAFAYFYLRSANNASLWRPVHITAPTGVGAAVFAFSVASAFLVGYGLWRFRAGSELDWQVSGWTGVLCTLTAVVAADLAADGSPVLSRIQRVRIVFHRLGRDEHRLVAFGRLLARDTSRAPASLAPCHNRRRGRRPLEPARCPALSRQPRGLHVLLVLHRFRSALFLGALLRGVRAPGSAMRPCQHPASSTSASKGGQ